MLSNFFNIVDENSFYFRKRESFVIIIYIITAQYHTDTCGGEMGQDQDGESPHGQGGEHRSKNERRSDPSALRSEVRPPRGS